MRIATANAYETGLDTLTRRQAEMSALQDQLTTGKRVGKASDDPAAAARAERALAAMTRADTSQRAVDASRVVVTQTESSIASADTLLQRARELVVASGNPSYSETDRQSVAAELQQIRDQLLTIANQTDGAGTHLFGGQGSTQAPFVESPTGVQYATTTGQTRTGTPAGLPLSTDGQATWLSARTGNGVFVTSASSSVTGATIDNGAVADPSAITGDAYSLVFSVAGAPPATTYAVLRNGAATAVTAAPYVAGEPITVDGMRVAVSGAPATGDRFELAPSTPTLSTFATLDKAIADLKTTGRSGSQRAQSNADSLRDLDSVMSNLQAARSACGAWLNRIDSETDRLADQKLASQTERSNAEDVDMVHAISDFQNRQSSYDAALKSYALVQRMSLFQYVNGG